MLLRQNFNHSELVVTLSSEFPDKLKIRKEVRAWPLRFKLRADYCRLSRAFEYGCSCKARASLAAAPAAACKCSDARIDHRLSWMAMHCWHHVSFRRCELLPCNTGCAPGGPGPAGYPCSGDRVQVGDCNFQDAFACFRIFVSATRCMRDTMAWAVQPSRCHACGGDAAGRQNGKRVPMERR